MRITLVKKKTSEEMTIQELADCEKPIACIRGVGGDKYMLLFIGNGKYVFVCPTDRSVQNGTRINTPECKLDALKSVKNGSTFHIFDTAKELYTWMSEE